MPDLSLDRIAELERLLARVMDNLPSHEWQGLSDGVCLAFGGQWIASTDDADYSGLAEDLAALIASAVNALPALLAERETLREKLEAVLMDANVTYGIFDGDGGSTPMMVERSAIVKALGYEDESAWLARTAEINAALAEGAPDG